MSITNEIVLAYFYISLYIHTYFSFGHGDEGFCSRHDRKAGCSHLCSFTRVVHEDLSEEETSFSFPYGFSFDRCSA